MAGVVGAVGDWRLLRIVEVMGDYRESNWWKYLDEPMRDLVQQSFDLLERFKSQDLMSNYHDYSFAVFPMAKAYEGFLKKVFLDMGLITRAQYEGDRFRIGKALNPFLPVRYRSGWVYGRLVAACRGEELPDKLWGVWKRARNRIFHYFPNHQEFLELEEAGQLVEEIAEAMTAAVEGCKLNFG